MGNVPDDVSGPRPFDALRDLGTQLVQPGQDRDRWKFRRRMVFGAVILLAVVLVILALGGDAAKFEATVWAFVSLVGIYIGAPVADDFLQSMPARAPRTA